MDKQKTVVYVGGRGYSLVSTESPEYMRRLAAYVDRKLKEVAVATGRPSGEVAVLSALNMADELMKAQDENSLLRRQMDAMSKELQRLQAENGAK